MKKEVVLPDLGEDSVDKVSVSEWLAKVGEHLDEGADLLEITTDKAAFCVPSPEAGTLLELKVQEGDSIRVGEILCVLDV